MSTYSRLLALVAATGALLMPSYATRAQLLITGNDEKVTFARTRARLSPTRRARTRCRSLTSPTLLSRRSSSICR